MTDNAYRSTVIRPLVLGLAISFLHLSSLSAQAKKACIPVLFKPAEQSFCLEIAADFTSRQTGLQNRQYLAPQGGMLFVFPDNKARAFWMKDTTLELDILFLDEQAIIQSFVSRVPPGPIVLHAPARYVIELPGGTAETLNLWPGDRVVLPDGLSAIE